MLLRNFMLRISHYVRILLAFCALVSEQTALINHAPVIRESERRKQCCSVQDTGEFSGV